MEDFEQQMKAIAIRAYGVRKSIHLVCKRAGVAPSTWTRWRNGEVAPNQTTINRLNEALDEFERETA